MKRLASNEEQEDHDHKKPKLSPSSLDDEDKEIVLPIPELFAEKPKLAPSSLDDEGKEIVLPIPELFADLQLHFERARGEIAALMHPQKSVEVSVPVLIDAQEMIRHRQRQLLQRMSTPTTATLVLYCNSKWFKIQEGEATTLVPMEVDDRREIIGMCVAGSDEIMQVVYDDDRSTFVDRLKWRGDNLELTEHLPFITSQIKRMMNVASDGKCLVSWCEFQTSLEPLMFARFHQDTKEDLITWQQTSVETEITRETDRNVHAHLTIMNDRIYTVASKSSYGVECQTIGVHRPQQDVIKFTIPRSGIEDARSTLKMVRVLGNSIPMLIGPGVMWVVHELVGHPKPQPKPLWMGRQDWDLLRKDGYVILSVAASGEFVWVLCLSRSLQSGGTIWIVEINLLAMTPQPRFIHLPIQWLAGKTCLFALHVVA